MTKPQKLVQVIAAKVIQAIETYNGLIIIIIYMHSFSALDFFLFHK